jgi:hypothetical protein
MNKNCGRDVLRSDAAKWLRFNRCLESNDDSINAQPEGKTKILFLISSNCLALNDTEGRAEKTGVSNRCLIFDDTDGTIGITEYGEQKRVSGKDAVAV